MPYNQETVKQAKRDCRYDEQIHRDDAVGVIVKERLPALRWRASTPGHILATLVCPILMPSFRSSPWIRGAPHSGLAILISRISRRISSGTVGRPLQGRDFQRQYDLKPARCQRT